MKKLGLFFLSLICMIVPHAVFATDEFDFSEFAIVAFEVSLPKYGEAPISVSGIGEGYVDLTIRRVGKVTDEIFKNYKGDKLFMRGPYGNGFDIDTYKGKEVVVVAGGTGLSPVRGIVEYFSRNPQDANGFTLISGFKSPEDVLFKNDIEEWKKNLNVIITVDNGISAHSEIKYAYELGMKVIVTDHHKIPEILPKCEAIIDPWLEKSLNNNWNMKFHNFAGKISKIQ